MHKRRGEQHTKFGMYGLKIRHLDVKHVIPCANGTDALQIAMMGLDLKPGDEVITADFTFAATVEVIALLQLTPVLVTCRLWWPFFAN